MFNKKKRKLSYLGPQPGTNSQPLNISTPNNQGNQLVVYYHSAQDCKLIALIKALCYDDLSSLGTAPLEELQKVWWNIYTEFIQLSDEPDIRLALRLTRSIYEMKYRKIKIECMVAYLAVKWDEDLVNELRRKGYRYKFDYNRPTEYTRDLKLILSRLKRYEIDIEIFQAELTAIEQKNTGAKVSEAYFTKTLVRLGNHNKYRIDREVITVAEYCALKTEYINYVKQTEQQNQKDARKR